MTVKQPKVYQLFCAPSVFMGFGIWKFCRKFLCRSCHVQVRCVKLQEYRLSWLRVSKTDVSITKYRSKVSAFDLFHAPCMPFCTNLEVAVDVWKLTQSCQQIPIELRQYFAFFLLQVGYIYLIICTQILFIYIYICIQIYTICIYYIYIHIHICHVSWNLWTKKGVHFQEPAADWRAFGCWRNCQRRIGTPRGADRVSDTRGAKNGETIRFPKGTNISDLWRRTIILLLCL